VLVLSYDRPNGSKFTINWKRSANKLINTFSGAEDSGVGRALAQNIKGKLQICPSNISILHLCRPLLGNCRYTHPGTELRLYLMLAYYLFSPVFTFFHPRHCVWPVPRSFFVIHSMQRSLEHESRQFAVHATVDGFAALKHACTRAALLDVYKFIPVKVDCERYTIKCTESECLWYLHPLRPSLTI